jgi:hypothetical protein
MVLPVLFLATLQPIPLHGPIIILGEGDLPGLPAVTGITGGSGTESDPYRIEGWRVVGPVIIQGTLSHIHIANVSVESAVVDRIGRMNHDLPHSVVFLRDVSNVSFAGLSVQGPSDLMTVEASSKVSIRDAEFHTPPSIGFGWGTRALRVNASQDISLRGGSIVGPRGVEVVHSSDVRLHGLSTDVVGVAVSLWNGKRLEVADSSFRGGNIGVVVGPFAKEVTVRHSLFEAILPEGLYVMGDVGVNVGVRVCENRFINAPILLDGLVDGLIVGNRITGYTTNGLRLSDGEVKSSNVSITGNFVGHSAPTANRGVDIFGPASATITANHFEGNAGWAVDAVDDDGRFNWWGSPSGPSGAGPGSGDRVAAGTLFEPWLLAPPPMGRC